MEYKELIEIYHLNPTTIECFQRYTALLQHSISNVTALHHSNDIIRYHFADSLELSTCIPLQGQTLVDVGSGGGFPGIPLKIAFPDCMVILIEVVAKKRAFLKHVIETLNLENIIIEEKDWRTFLRTSPPQADIVCARASLPPAELLRMFQPHYHYENATLVYWASASWQPSPHEAKYVQEVHPYEVGDRERKLIVFRTPEKM
jgi:16S rRNA (guanine(527)-N(7))-methyltransferase RsmG